jgi:leucyl/phenylalanyl-tRNA---protein transferase
MRRRRPPLFIPPGGPLYFPNPEPFDDEGLIAIGGDLAPARLLLAYDEGIFPWYEEGLPPLWWSPDPRAVIEPGDLHVSRSMRRFLRSHGFGLSWDRAFGAVMRACAAREEGTWILPEMIEAYAELHRSGHAHSIEVWKGGTLVGGLYGVQRGALFAAESMFHRATNASKLALIECVERVAARGIELVDVQFPTPHLESLGATVIPRAEYRRRLLRSRHKVVELGSLIV